MRPRAARGTALARASQQLFLQLVRGRPGPQGWPAEDAADWGGALTLLLAHGVAPLLHAWALKEVSALPPAVIKHLHRIRAAELLVETRREAALQRALAALAGKDASPLPVLLLKGAASARTLYAAPELRPRGDLDLLVSPVRFAEALARFDSAGYRHHPKVRGTAEEESGWHERTLIDPVDPSCVLDLHQELLQTGRQGLLAGGLLERSLPAPGLGGRARLCSAEDALLSCVVSLGAHELRSPLVVACDLALLVGRCDLAMVARRAAEARIERMLLLALRWLGWAAGEPTKAAALCGLPVDHHHLAALAEALRLSSPLRAALGAVAARYDVQRQPLSRAEQLVRKGLLIDRPWDAVRFAARTLQRALRLRL